jgi:hypothetical protein
MRRAINGIMRKLFLLAVMSAAAALGAACSSSSSNGATASDDTSSDDDIAHVTLDGGTDATLPDACSVQSYPANAASCPTTYSISYAGQLCSPAGLQCWYPGKGDFGANGCASAATLLCEFPDSGLGDVPDAAIFDDAGDASVGYWTFAQ